MKNSIVKIPQAVNEPIRNYSVGSKNRENIKQKLQEMESVEIEIPLIINGKEIFTGNTKKCVIPHDHKHVLAIYHMASEKEINLAIKACSESKKSWEHMPWESRAAIYKRMASLLAGPYRDIVNAATMLSQSKNIFQAEIDSACELIDFFNFNVEYMQQIYSEQPPYSPQDNWNIVQYRPLEGFVFAITPFNFTSIAGNLPTAPALMGNTVIWKPASSSVYSGYFLMKLFEEAGMPPGVINFLPGSGKMIGDSVIKHPDLAGIHFTGSTAVFQSMWKTIGANIDTYKSYPRIVGETGGKDFILAHKSANKKHLVTAMIRGSFEYQGQKCSAASRCYIHKSMWNEIKEIYIKKVNSIKLGEVIDFSNFMNAVIDENAFDSIVEYIDYAKQASDAEIITGGDYDKSEGYFISPTTIVTSDPKFKTMVEEIFGPVLTIYIYDNSWEEICKIVDETSPYALTGAIFSTNRDKIVEATNLLTHSAGNFYINDKPTGAVVGQQPFGGARASGTNDKAGSSINLLRWTSQRTIKETYNPPEDYKYPFMKSK